MSRSTVHPAGASASGTTAGPLAMRSGFTLIELVIVIAVILILLAMLMPVLSLVREHSARNQAHLTVSQVHQALQGYAAEERRHRFPPQAADLALAWSPDASVAPPGIVNQLLDAGFAIDLARLDRRGAPPHLLADPWTRPFRYQADNDLMGSAGAQRPLGCDGASPPLVGWNAAGIRPWGYVWSTGKEAQPDGTGWIYQRDSR